MVDKTLSDLLVDNDVDNNSFTGTEPFETVFATVSGAATFNGLSQTIVNSIPDANYTLVRTDQGKMINGTSTSSRSVTIPTNASVAFPINTTLLIRRGGTGALSIAAASGVVIEKRATLSLSLIERYALCVLHKIGTNTWQLTGELTAL